MGMTADQNRTGAGRGAWLMAWTLVAMWVLAFADRLIIMLLVPGMKQSLGITDTQVALLHGPAFSVVFALAGLLLGRLVDRVNRRNLLFAALVVWSLAEVAAGLAQSFTELFAARMLLGVAQAALAPASLSLIGDLFPAERRGRPTAFIVAASSIGSALSSMAGGVLLQALAARPSIVVPGIGALAAWQSTMAIFGIPGVLLALLYFAVREPARQQTRTGSGAAHAGDSFVLLAHLRENATLFSLLFAAFSCTLLIGYGVGSWYAPLLMRSGLPPAQTGLAMGALTLVAGLVAGGAGGWISDWAARDDRGGGRLRLICWLMAAQIVAQLPLWAAPNIPALLVSYALLGMTMGTTGACIYAVLAGLVPSRGRGQIIAVYQLISNLIGLGLGPMLVALLVDRMFHDEAMLNFAMLDVGLPAAALGLVFVLFAIPRARRLHAELEGRAC